MRFVHPSNWTAMERLVEELHQAQPTYADIGATLAGVRPEGFHYDRYETVLGHGSETFERAVYGLKTWEAHRVPGIQVSPKRGRSRLVRPLP